MKEQRTKRAIKMMESIRDIYHINIDIETLLKESQIITRANMYRNILKSNDIGKDFAHFVVSKKSEAYIPSIKTPTEEGIDLLRKSGSIVIFAHPCLVKDKATVTKVLEMGVDGIEVRYPSLLNNEEEMRGYAKQYGILPSAGSDCHGDDSHADIGTCTLDRDEFLPIAEKINMKV